MELKAINSKPYISLIIGVILIGLSPILIKLAHAPGVVTAFYRLSIGTLGLIIPFIVSLRNLEKPISKRGILLAFLGGICLASDMALWTTGIVASNATLPTLVGNMAPIWVGLGALLIFKEKQGFGFWSGLFLAIIGLVLLASKDVFKSDGTVKGIILGLLAGIFYAGFLLFTQSGRQYLNTISYLFISSLSTTIVLGIFMLLFKYEFTGYDNYTWGLWIIMGLGFQIGAWYLINYSQGYLPASLVSPTLLGQPVVTAIVSFLFLREIFSFTHILGGIIIMGGIYWVHFSRMNNL